ncbi:nucleotidyltransferase family protein [Eremococcus coleocola]|uniref:tRNA(Met) cytidine acetate ligase n=1 Tax=Eremococcus coleocola ACS-139-V-Col8 TaxID=908337 RepID=E4KPB6_9LACT|nr:nucleotidyltransferase family protein [Eremococcus coleocola]EFR31036.1 hypothetical protein HMPREF9257_1403 [Eremococcus coleocola ACS-139-V-Col8]
MDAFGIIAEYNPFHLGHDYQMKQFKESLDNQAILLVLMSGNSVQRGEFAAYDKWSRAQMALAAGADLVIEAPVLMNLQAADQFAQVGVNLLDLLACASFGFGTEKASLSDLENHLTWRHQNQLDLDQAVQKQLKQGLSYAAAYQEAIHTLGSQSAFDPSLPNHLLALQYIQANQSLSRPMVIQVLKRLVKQDKQRLMSGSQIRSFLAGGGNPQCIPLPKKSQELVQDQALVTWEDYFHLLKYRLLTHSPESLSQIFGVREGLEYSLLAKIEASQSFDDFISLLTSKRWTRASLQRICLAILLNISWQEFEAYRAKFWQAPCLRCLAVSGLGQTYLRQLDQSKIKVFANLKQDYINYGLNLRVDKVFSMNDKVSDQIKGRFPLGIKK